jgi:hypothetical protein
MQQPLYPKAECHVPWQECSDDITEQSKKAGAHGSVPSHSCRGIPVCPLTAAAALTLGSIFAALLHRLQRVKHSSAEAHQPALSNVTADAPQVYSAPTSGVQPFWDPKARRDHTQRVLSREEVPARLSCTPGTPLALRAPARALALGQSRQARATKIVPCTFEVPPT